MNKKMGKKLKKLSEGKKSLKVLKDNAEKANDELNRAQAKMNLEGGDSPAVQDEGFQEKKKSAMFQPDVVDGMEIHERSAQWTFRENNTCSTTANTPVPA